jgi:hypothetical protein
VNELLLRNTITIYTNSECNLACPACNDRDRAKADPTYETTVNDIDRLIESCQRHGYEFEVNLAGGEPLLWSNLEVAVDRISRAVCFGSITLFTNGMYPDRLSDELVDRLTTVRVSVFGSVNAAAIEKVRSRVPPGKLRLFDARVHYHNARDRGPDSVLPARCWTAEEIEYFNGRVYVCCMARNLALRFGLPFKSNPVESPFMDGLADGRYVMEGCRYCLANLNNHSRVDPTTAHPERREYAERAHE